MTKVIIRKQYIDNSKCFFQISWMSADGSIESNCNATQDQVIGVSNVATRAGFEYVVEVKAFDGGEEITDTWEEKVE